MFFGLPLAVTFFLRGSRAWAAVSRAVTRKGPVPSGVELLTDVTAAGIALLVLSGLTRGEVGRIWIPVMPLLLVP